jgi:hypothetical protein
MPIILEGNDSSGKSFLANRIGLPIYRSGGPPRDHAHMVQCLREQQIATEDGMVLDRVTCISQQIYSKPQEIHRDYLLRMLSTPGTILVYCRPSDLNYALSKHEVKAYDTVEHLEMVVSNYHIIAEKYDLLMTGIPHISYDWQNEDLDNGSFIRQIKEWQRPSKWNEYLNVAMQGTKYARHKLLGQKVHDVYTVRAIMDVQPAYALCELNDGSIAPQLLADLC